LSEYILEARGIEKSFPGVKALDKVDFAVRRGEVHALVGENGAGKSTLMMVLGGVYVPEAGEVHVDGKAVRFRSPRDSIQSGIGIVFQELSLVPHLSVAENIYFNRQPVKLGGRIDRKRLQQLTTEMLARFGITHISPATLVRDLSIANQQVIEILKAMSEAPKIIVLDEPTSSLTEVEVARLFENIRRLQNEGISFVYISHHLNEVFEIADSVTVLRDGQKVVTAKVADVDEDFLISHMVGRSIENIYGSRAADAPLGEVIFRAENLTREGVFRDVSFDVREGEIVGFSGLVGAGRTEVARSIFGADPLTSGSMTLDGKPFCVNDCARAIKEKVGYMTEDRKTLGLFLDFDITQNFAANRLGGYVKHGMMCDGDLCFVSEQIVKDFRVVTSSIEKKVRELSGGNQQKVLLASWMSIDPKILFVDEPTRGVDVGAKWEIYQLLRNLAKEKRCGIVVISSDLPEILGLSDRIVVMKEGRVAGILDGSTATEKSVMKLAIGSGGEEDGNG